MSMLVGNLRCEGLANPLGIEYRRPRLSWRIKSNKRGIKQKAYRILVSTAKELLDLDNGNLWDSGKVDSDQSVHVQYRGRPMRSRMRCWWKVKVWDADGHESEFSEPASWEMGLLNKSDWHGAQWIGKAPRKEWVSIQSTQYEPSPIFRRTFNVNKKVESARAYICGLGYYELRINGDKVGEHVLEPTFTNYDKRALYLTHDITEHITRGENAIGVMLGNGWYNMHTIDNKRFFDASWRDLPKLLLKIWVAYEDGSEETLHSDTSWGAAHGPITMDSIRNGEFYNAGLEKEGWDTPEYEEPEGEWPRATAVKAPRGKLVAHQMPRVKVIRTIKPVKVEEIEPGVFRYDMGEDIAGYARLRVSGPSGAAITLTYTELPDENVFPTHWDGRPHLPNNAYVLSGKFQTDRYTLKGEGEEVWEPRFTYHGFRYVRVEGFPGKPGLKNLEGRVVHTDFERCGEFECSNKMLNRVRDISIRAWLSNHVGNPTDCPQREKAHWTLSFAADYPLMLFDPYPTFRKWLGDHRDALPGRIHGGAQRPDPRTDAPGRKTYQETRLRRHVPLRRALVFRTLALRIHLPVSTDAGQTIGRVVIGSPARPQYLRNHAFCHREAYWTCPRW